MALVFGPEDHAANEDLKRCHQLLTIPTSADHTSLNLSQAVMVCVYELSSPAQPRRDQADEDMQLATAA